jgi:hypothetical protein
MRRLGGACALPGDHRMSLQQTSETIVTPAEAGVQRLSQITE